MIHAYAMPGLYGERRARWWKGLNVFESRSAVEGSAAGESESERREDRTGGRLVSTLDSDNLVAVSIVLTMLSIAFALFIALASHALPPFPSPSLLSHSRFGQLVMDRVLMDG